MSRRLRYILYRWYKIYSRGIALRILIIRSCFNKQYIAVDKWWYIGFCKLKAKESNGSKESERTMYLNAVGGGVLAVTQCSTQPACCWSRVPSGNSGVAGPLTIIRSNFISYCGWNCKSISKMRNDPMSRASFAVSKKRDFTSCGFEKLN